MTRKTLPYLLLTFALAGCGGGSPSPSAPSSRGGGSATVTIAWPARSRLVPLTANSAVVVLSLGRAEAARRTVVRSGDGASVGSVAFAGLALGRYAVDVRTYPAGDGTGVASALGAATLVVGKAPATLAVSPSSTVATLALSAPASTVKVGEALALVASAKDKDGALVLLASDGIQEKLDWSVSPAGAATVQGTGTSVVLTGVAPGDATVTARLKIKDDGTTVDATLPVWITRKIVATGLATAGWPIAGGDSGRAFSGRGPVAAGVPGAPITVGSSWTTAVVGSDGTLYTASAEKVAARGAANWEVANEPPTTYSHPLALTQGGVLLVATDKGLFARDATDGGLLWSFPSVYDFAVGRDGTVYVSNGGKLCALDGATGAVRWSAPGIDIGAIGEDGALYGIASVAGTGYHALSTYYLRRYDPSNGAQRWSAFIGYSSIEEYSGLTVAGGSVYLKTSTQYRDRYRIGRVLAFDASSGASKWSYAFPTSYSYQSVGSDVAVRGGKVFAQWNHRAVAVDAATGRGLWDVPGGHRGYPAAVDGAVYCIVDTDPATPYTLRALDPATGATRWQTTLADPSTYLREPVLADDGTIYIPAYDGRIYPIR